jgi:hypothetical protein
MRMNAHFWRLTLALLLLPLGLTIGGCGGGKGTVSGKVTYNGQIVPAGSVQIMPSNGPAITCEIQEDGSYKVSNVAVGKAKVVVETESANSKGGGGQAMQPQSKDAAMYKNAQKERPFGAPPDADPSQMPNYQKPRVEKKYVPIPKDYGDPNKTKLELTVKSGNNDFPIDLK